MQIGETMQRVLQQPQGHAARLALSKGPASGTQAGALYGRGEMWMFIVDIRPGCTPIIGAGSRMQLTASNHH